MNYASHYVFALGYRDGVNGSKNTIGLDRELKAVYNAGYEQGTNDYLFGKVNTDLVATQ